ncbi:hypothetical protein BJX76DRAFT_324458 [Aspergillus varians]
MNTYSPLKTLANLSQPCIYWSTTTSGHILRRSGVHGIPRGILQRKTCTTISRSISSHATSISNEPSNSHSQRVHKLSLQLSQRPMNGNALMQYKRYNNTDTSTSPGIDDQETHPQIQRQTKLAIAEEYGLSTRDLRAFDHPSPGFPHILVRDDVILIHLFDLRLLLKYDHVLVFHVTDRSLEDGGAVSKHDDDGTGCDVGDDGVSRVFSHNHERKLLNHSHAINQPYELRVVEAALASVTSVLEAEYTLTADEVSKVLQTTHQDTYSVSDKDKEDESLIHTLLHTLLHLSRRLASIDQSARQLRALISEVLAEDEDMANMYLTDKSRGRPHQPSDHQEIEYIFEAYFKASDSIVQEAKRMMGNITRTEETIRAALSVRRNQIMVLEARIEILMLALGGATLVAGWYGMNVVNGAELSQGVFGVIVLGSLLGVGVITWGGLRRLKGIRRLRV